MYVDVIPLPYAKDALEPVMKQETVEFHYERHHKGYMAKLKSLIAGKPEEGKSLVELMRTSSGAVFNNAAQVWNHDFFWESMKPNGGGAPPAGDVGDLIAGLGGWEKFRADFIAAGVARFGSGYAWLVLDRGKGRIIDTPNAENPLTTGATPLLTCDVWEHAYYLDHRNNRQAFLEVFLDRLVSWDFVARNARAASQAA
ncbi:superoxide dismutase [Sorangium cellulosum]|uniref:Superoxide dismutase n=1 Tax=Sorangium cellulosum TaxID=56 RepID=A0A4P2Q8A7_SORCE|nr:superoxide dismutase [Sorangium cellulosum]